MSYTADRERLEAFAHTFDSMADAISAGYSWAGEQVTSKADVGQPACVRAFGKWRVGVIENVARGSRTVTVAYIPPGRSRPHRSQQRPEHVGRKPFDVNAAVIS